MDEVTAGLMYPRLEGRGLIEGRQEPPTARQTRYPRLEGRGLIDVMPNDLRS